jgi:hypothetical protein
MVDILTVDILMVDILMIDILEVDKIAFIIVLLTTQAIKLRRKKKQLFSKFLFRSIQGQNFPTS